MSQKKIRCWNTRYDSRYDNCLVGGSTYTHRSNSLKNISFEIGRRKFYEDHPTKRNHHKLFN